MQGPRQDGPGSTGEWGHRGPQGSRSTNPQPYSCGFGSGSQVRLSSGRAPRMARVADRGARFQAAAPIEARLLPAELQLLLGLLPVLGVPAVPAAAGLEDLVGALRD